MHQSKKAPRAAPRRWPPLAAAAVTAASLAGAALVLPARDAEAAPVDIEVYKSPTCGCCEGWIEHMEAGGFRVKVHDTQDLQTIKREAGVPPQLSSCHTAVAHGYIVEGHIPSDVIRKLLAERPAVQGIGVRGMPAGSPGMEQGARKEPYAVLAFDARGQTSVFARK